LGFVNGTPSPGKVKKERKLGVHRGSQKNKMKSLPPDNIKTTNVEQEVIKAMLGKGWKLPSWQQASWWGKSSTQTF